MEPTERTVRNPFDGNPETWEETDENGNPEIHVIPKVLTPARAKIADALAMATAVTVPVLSTFYVLNHSPSVITLAVAGSTWFLRPLVEKSWREALKRKVHIVLTPEEFRFRGWRGWISFNRALPHRFMLKHHDLARQERDQHEFKALKAQQQRKVVQPRRYYQDSYHLSFDLLRQRNDIIEIFGQPEAQTVLNRLVAVDEVINGRARRDDGIALKPAHQWRERTGAIPETPGR